MKNKVLRDKIFKGLGSKSALIIKDEINVNYLINSIDFEGVVLLTTEEIYFFTDLRYYERASLELNDIKIICNNRAHDENILDIIGKAGYSKIFFEGSLSIRDFDRYFELFDPLEVLYLENDLLREIRSIKSDEEIKKIKKSAEINDHILSEIISKIEVGTSELEIKNELEFQLRKAGASKASFDLIIISGGKTSLPHGVANNKKIVYNEPILFDIGVFWEGYASDMTRMVYMGDPEPKFLKNYQIVKNAQKIGLEAVKKGVETSKIDKKVRSYFESEGVLEYFFHSTGHGVGREIHEYPNISKYSDEILAVNNIVTVEPGLYFPNEFGIRIEDLIQVKDDGYEILSKTSKKLVIR